MKKRNLNVHKYIREARGVAGHSQVSMAKVLGVARQTYLDLENGKTEPKLAILLDICEVTGKPLSYFIQDDYDMDYRQGLFLLEGQRKAIRKHLGAVLKLL